MSDASYIRWIQTLPSALTGDYGEYLHGDGRNDAAHVRRGGKSGTAYKEPFATIPLTHAEHDWQSRHGELSCLQRFAPWLGAETVDEAKALFDAFLEVYRKRWSVMTRTGIDVDAL